MEKSPIVQPLVSIYVITYKSSRTVLETLESIKAQTYYNIELIITDDNSPDDTVEKCQKWLVENGDRFPHVELVTSEINTGLIGNGKRGRDHAHGEWLKGFAGDDILIPTAVEEYMKFAAEHPDAWILMADVDPFADEGELPEKRKKEYDNYFRLANRPYNQQWLHCLQENIFVGPGVMSSRRLWEEMEGLITSKWINADEWPFFYNVLKKKHQVYCINKKLVKYRFSNTSISHEHDGKGMRNKKLELSTCGFFFENPFKDLIEERHYLIAWDCYLHYKTIQLYYKHDGRCFEKYLMMYSKFLSPYGYWKRIKRTINKKQI